MNKESELQIVLVGPNGSKTKGPSLDIPPPRKRQLRTLNDAQWAKSVALARFKRYLFRQDAEGLKAAIRALDRLDCCSDAVRQLKLNRPTEKHARALVSFWIQHGLSSIPRGLRDNIPDFIDALRRFVKPYEGPTVTLYRGELKARFALGICGIAWTTNLNTAEMFADRRVPLREGAGVVLKIEATADVIVADLKRFSSHTTHIGEDEYLVDPRLIHAMISVLK